MLLAQEGSPPAGGAEFGQIVLAALMFAVVFLPLAVFVIRERAGKRTVIGRVADWMGRVGGMPRWAAMPMLVAGLSGLAALIGVYWDVPIHMELGRDEGPLANPSHYPIYFGLMGIFASGVLSAALAKGDLPARTFKIGPHWRAPMGSIQMMGTGLVGVAGFPLDDVWHRLFGQDVTEWGPTHVLMIGGGIGVVIGIQLLLAEARQVGATGLAVRVQGPVLAGAWTMGASAFLMEFDLGVPQFPMLAQVVLVGLIGSWTLVFARLSWGPGGTLFVLAVFLLTRALFAVLPAVDGLHVASLLPYVAEAVVIEVVALLVGAGHGWRFPVVAGLASGTVGLLGEYQFSQWLMPNPWPAAHLPLFLVFGALASVGGALVGAWQHRRVSDVAALRERPTPAEPFRTRHLGGLVGALLVTGLMAAVVVPADPPPGLSADIALSESPQGQEISNPHGGGVPRWVNATVTISDPELAGDAVWLNGFAWQGGDFYTAPLVEVADGVYRTAEPLPAFGQWKSGIRLHAANRVMTLAPIYAPADPAANAPEISAVSGPRDFISEISFLQRERKTDTPLVLWTIGYLLVGAIFAGMWAFFAWLYAAAAAGAPTARREVSALP
ncbi:hypothetical protein UO65_5567 [Actinokineospora spheciospongiae]|uniref:Uncharacterized protein n=1 Tax=Actinokineospora spheciospongiae TaxID=909613 RepID=W7IE76_9PSEU|nr:hypothetical protein [Actinokineospora spheciospongiae]EWC59140.1 hypothetical protein UO65_5567 [Actinokineospora spheciospongiae]PWW59523.1 hypothetical protein DFQ13_108160 [Actinokineospora spheciospongiae]